LSRCGHHLSHHAFTELEAAEVRGRVAVAAVHEVAAIMVDTLGFQERQQVGIMVFPRRWHAVRKALVGFNVLFLNNFAGGGAESAYGTIWSSSPCITRTATVTS